MNNLEARYEARSSSSADTRGIQFLTIFLLIISLWIFAANLWDKRFFSIDDAFIEFRYAQNLVNGHGLVWNPSEPPREGYSNFLSILIFAPFIFFKFDPLITSKIVGIASVLLTAYLLYKICKWKGVSKPVSLLVSCIYITLPAMSIHSLSGLQTTLFSAALFFLFFCAVKTRIENNLGWYILLPIAYIIAILARPEGVFFSSLFLLFICFHRSQDVPPRSKVFVISCAVCFLIGGSYLFWKLIYFGTILSAPFLVKISIPWSIPGKFELILFVLRYSFLFLLAFVGLAISYRKSVLIKYALFFALLIPATYLFNCHLMGFESRFFMPSIPFLLILTANAFELLLSAIPRKSLQYIFLVSSVVLINPSNINPSGTSFVRIRKFFFPPGEKHHESWTDVDIKIGKQLSKLRNPAKVVIVSEDTGAIGYYSGATVIDIVGLTNPYIAASKDKSEFTNQIFSYSPDIVILRKDRDQQSSASESDNEISKIRWWQSISVWGAAGRFGKSCIINDKRFKDKYVFIGSILDSDESISIYTWNFWVRTESPYFLEASGILKDLVEEDIK